MKRVMLMSPFFFPELISTGLYNTRLAEYLRDSGAAVSVACSHPLYPEWVVRKCDEGLAGIQILRGGGLIRYPKSTFLRRLVLESWFTVHGLRLFLSLRARVDTVILIFPPSLFWSVAARFVPSGLRIVGIVHDLQGIYAERLGSRFSGWILTAIRHVERSAFNRCDRLVFLSSTMRDIAIRQYGVQSEKSFVVYPPATVVDDSALSLLPVLRDQSVRHVVYSGALGVKQDPNALFALLSAIAKARSDVRCHIFSGGPVFNRLRAAQAATDLVQFHDLVSAREIASMYEGSAVQIVTEEPGTSQGSLPSKVANILWMGVPLYCVTDSGSELAQLVEASGIGKVDSSFNLEPQVRTLSDWIDESSAWDRQASKAKVRELIGLKFSFNRILDLL